MNDPGNVKARVRRIPRTIYGNMARTYDAFPELLTPFTKQTNTIAQDSTKKRVRLKSGVPIPSSMFAFSFRTSLLKIRNKSVNKYS